MSQLPEIPQEVEQHLASLDPDESRELRAVWSLLGAAQPVVDQGVIEAGWQDFRSRVAETAESPTGLRLVVSATRLTRWAAVAAAILVVVGSGLALRTPVYTAAPGEQVAVDLRDGSQVVLNAGSRLQGLSLAQRVVNPERAREYVLDGEGFFDVEKGTSPFVVSTFNARVEVLGTRFDVRAYRDGFTNATEVVVEEGVVELGGSSRSVELTQGMSSVVPQGSTVPSVPVAVDVERVVSWKAKSFSILDRPLGTVFAELERRFGVEIRVRGEVNLEARKTLYYSADRSIESIVSDLAQSAGLTYRPILNGFEVSGAR